MYYLESDTIADENPDLRKSITELDDHLFANQEGYIRIDPTADLLEMDTHILQNLLLLYREQGVLISQSVALCPKCDIPIECETTTGEVRCDLCDRNYNFAKLQQETVFYARATMFESGDRLAMTTQATYDVEGVFKVAGCTNEGRVADIVFVHGLGGDATQTWSHDTQPESYWPRWVHEKLPNVGVWSLEYEAAKTKWTGDALALPDRAADVLERLTLAGLGHRPIIFVTHSLGGLVVKELLKRGNSDGVEDWKHISSAVRGVMFIATPHSGSDLSGYFQYVESFARTTAAISDLRAHHPRLRESNVWFRNNVSQLGITVAVLYETKPTSAFGIGAMVVDQTSADPGIQGISPIPIEQDHISICKPTAKSSVVFLQTIRLIARVIASNPANSFRIVGSTNQQTTAGPKKPVKRMVPQTLIDEDTEYLGGELT